MSARNLQHLFAPRSIAVIGASDKEQSVGATVLRNVISGGFKGAILPVNLKYSKVQGLKCYKRIAELPRVPELALICTPPESVPGLIRELGALGTHAAIVLTAGLGGMVDRHGVSLKQAMLDAARPTLMRILGPNCIGMLVPGIGLNASFAHTSALPGRIAFVSQSGALVTSVLDWAKSRGIGFSKFISLGEGADIDFGDLLDYLASDPETDAILMYMEDVRHARKFMSAARAAARSKPTLILKAGRMPEGAQAAASHTGALAGSDDVYDAAIRRAGMLRVLTTEDLFSAVETLSRARPQQGERLTIMTNGGGPGVMATDALISSRGKLATVSASTLDQLNAILPSTWSHANPVDIIGDAPAERYRQSMEVLLRDEDSDALLLIHSPSAIVPSAEIARALVPVVQASGRNVLACWLGGDALAQARQVFSAAGVPSFDTPEAAVNGFQQIVRYRQNQNLLMQAPTSTGDGFVPDRAAAQAVVQIALASGRDMLSEPEAKTIMAAYGIPVVETRTAHSIDEAVQFALEIGFPVAVKILSPDISHKSDIGGVMLDLETPEAVRAAAEAIKKRMTELCPQAHLQGYAVQQMARRPNAVELIVGVATDPVFGPVVLFGRGGIAVEITADHAVGLPPLNNVLAADMVARTRVAKVLVAYRNRPAADMDAILRTLIQVSQLITDIPEILELDINPLLADASGVIALDARIKVAAPASADPLARLAIRPYPQELEQAIEWQGAPLLIRPVRPEDGAAHLAFFAALDPEDVHYRMFVRMRELGASQLARFTQIDYDREMAFIATRQRPDGAWETLGVARAIADPDNIEAEFAVTVRSDVKDLHLGRILMAQLIAYCRSRGTSRMVGEALPHNSRVLGMVNKLGFTVGRSSDGETMHLQLDL